MVKPTKHKIGFRLLLSLIPVGIVFIISVVGGVLSNNAEPTGWSLIAFLCILYGVIAIPTGLTLWIMGNREFNRAYHAAQRYAELNGWHTISRTAWRNRKRNQITLSVSQAFAKQTYILSIEIEGETITVDEFETSVWALEFGDWLWQELLEANQPVDKVTVDEKRVEWEQSRAMTLHRPSTMERRV